MDEKKEFIDKYRSKVEEWFLLKADFETLDIRIQAKNIKLLSEKQPLEGIRLSVTLIAELEKEAEYKEGILKLEYWKKAQSRWEKRYEKCRKAILRFKKKISKSKFWEGLLKKQFYLNKNTRTFLSSQYETDINMEVRKIESLYREYNSYAWNKIDTIKGKLGIKDEQQKFQVGIQTCRDMIFHCIKKTKELETYFKLRTKRPYISKIIEKYEGLKPWNRSYEDLESLADKLFSSGFIKDKRIFINIFSSQNSRGEKCIWSEKSKAMPHLDFLLKELKNRNILIVNHNAVWGRKFFIDDKAGSISSDFGRLSSWHYKEEAETVPNILNELKLFNGLKPNNNADIEKLCFGI